MGNVTSSGAGGLTYDDAGRLVGAGGREYFYNGLGQRVRKKLSASESIYYVYDEAGHLLGEYDTAGDLIEETVWLGDTPVATLRPAGGGGVEIFYVHTDHLNTPRMITQASNNAVRWQWDDSGFGDSSPDENPESAGAFEYNLRFPGQYFDEETGLSYNYLRDYDPATGRYVESDPAGLGGGVNTYAYVGGNPISFVDQYGLMICGDWGWMAIDWALGLGSRNRTYTDFADQTQEVKNLPPIETARQLYRQKNSAEKGKGDCCDKSKLQPVTNVAAKFGLRQFMQATLQASCAWHFIGSFDIDVFPVSCTKARIRVTNNSSFRSFAYGVGPSWSRGPGSNFYQTYEWEEDL
jgi:RHS repeat-associated protein